MTIANPFSSYGIDWDWADHKAHGYQGGTDYKVPSGTAVTSPGAGKISYMHDGLNGVRVTFPSGRSAVIRELRSIDIADGAEVAQGQRIGTTGRKNGKITMWPHIEGWIDGVRVPFDQVLAAENAPAPQPAAAAPAASPQAPVTGSQVSAKADIQRIARYLNGRQLGIDSNAATNGIRGKAYWHMVQTAGHQDGLYPVPPYRINDIPGARTFWLEAHYNSIAR